MTWTAPKVQRTDPSELLGEREALQAWLDYHRATLRFKCQGLTGDQLIIKAAEPSTLSLLGLVRHMAEVERSWFRHGFARQSDTGPLYYSDEFPDGDFDHVRAEDAEADFATFVTECELADAAVSDRGLDETFTRRSGVVTDLRWIYLHMIEEYARHNGHADLLRERIDGVKGD